MRATLAICIALGLTLVASSCGTSEYACAKDYKTITKIDEAFVVDHRRDPSKQMDLLHFDEVPYAVIPTSDMALQENVPVEVIAEGYKDKLFCSVACATPMLLEKNNAVERLVVERRQQRRTDSLVQDSIRRGLIR